MTIEKLPSGNYRVTQMYKGKRYRFTLDHKPTQKEATLLLANTFEELDEDSAESGTFDSCIDDYIESKKDILSPSSIRGYKSIQRNCPEWFLRLNIYDINQEKVQKVVNEYSKGHSPKSTKNFNGLIVTVMKFKRPRMALHTTLPQKLKKDITIPNQADIWRLLDELKGTEYYIPIYLGCLGLRRSEVTALQPEDFHGNILSINKALITDDDGNLIVKTTKTTESTREIYVPDELVEAVKEKGYVYNGYPNNILRALHKYQDKLGMPRCRFHDLRHFYVSYAHSVGMSDAEIMKAGGWISDDVMKRVYRHSIDSNSESEQKRIANSMFSH